MKTQFLDGVDGVGNVNTYINSGASAISSIANLVSAAKGTGVQNLTQQPTSTSKTVVVPSTNSTSLLQQQLLLQQAAKSNTGLSTNAMIGIAVGGVAVLGLIIAVIATKK